MAARFAEIAKTSCTEQIPSVSSVVSQPEKIPELFKYIASTLESVVNRLDDITARVNETHSRNSHKSSYSPNYSPSLRQSDLFDDYYRDDYESHGVYRLHTYNSRANYVRRNSMDQEECRQQNDQFHRSIYTNQQRVGPDLKICSGQIWHKKIAQSDSNESRPTDGKFGYEGSPEQRRILNEVNLLMQRNQSYMSDHFNSSENHKNSSTRKETDKDSNNRGIMPVVNDKISSENEVEMNTFPIASEIYEIQELYLENLLARLMHIRWMRNRP